MTTRQDDRTGWQTSNQFMLMHHVLIAMWGLGTREGNKIAITVHVDIRCAAALQNIGNFISSSNVNFIVPRPLFERLDFGNHTGPSRFDWVENFWNFIIVQSRIRLYRVDFFLKNNNYTSTIIRDFRVCSFFFWFINCINLDHRKLFILLLQRVFQRRR